MKLSSKILALVLIVATTPAFAGRRDQNRQRLQEARIAEGVQTGELNPAEARRLKRGEHRIDRMQHRAEADGVVTPGEEARINHRENIESRRIYRQKHDGQTAPAAPATPPEAPTQGQ